MNLSFKQLQRRDFIKLIATFFMGKMAIPSPLWASPSTGASAVHFDNHIRDYLFKMSHFDEPSQDDIYVDPQSAPVMASCVARLHRLQRTVGHGNFQMLGFDEGFKIARNYTKVGAFPRAEREFLDRIFHEQASVYGFYGEKPLDRFNKRIRKRDVVKIPGTGNFILRGEPVKKMHQIAKDLGPHVVLTSGVRGVPKQFLLFLNKARKYGGNLSLASRSLAPPGYSYHGVGDFDVGQVGFGTANFTEAFTSTEVCRRLNDLGYITLRYKQHNRLGVRFEPWHIKVISA